MNTTSLFSLRDYLFSTLTPSNLIWLGAQLTEYGSKKKEEEPLKPYTMNEIFKMINESEIQIAKGETLTDDEVWSKYDKEMK